MTNTTTRRNFLAIGAGFAALSAMPRFAYAQAAGTFRIGSLCPISGGGSSYGSGMQKAIEIALAEVNADGGDRKSVV